jgi:NADH-quinone oxidoreductase subunit M
MVTSMTLDWTIYISFLGAALLLCIPGLGLRAVRGLALGTALAGLGIGLAGALRFPSDGELVRLVQVPWVPSLGFEFHLAADGISMAMVVLTGLAAVAGVLFSWNVRDRVREFFIFFLVMIGATYGVFLSFDLFLFFVFYEVVIIPKYFLIAIWGSTRREYGAMKLVLYSAVGGALVLAGLAVAYVQGGASTMDLSVLSARVIPVGVQSWLFPLLCVGFGILAGLWPFHTWAPTGHVAAPTAASMLLAGVVMKLGAYGILRVAIPLCPEGWEAWAPVFGGLSVTGIVVGAFVALAQRDFKFVIGYSSVSHMGFVLLGLFSLSATGLSGAVMQMFSHGVIAGLLFAVVGRMVYDRTHTRDLEDLSILGLGRVLPFAGVTFAVAALASMGLPGFSGFVAELQVLVGAWERFAGYAFLAGIGIVLGAGYSLRALQKSFYAEEQAGKGEVGVKAMDYEPVTVPERLGAVLLIAASLVVGLYPRVLLDWIVPAFEGGFFTRVREVMLP